MTKYWTESGSVYQVDEEHRRARQLVASGVRSHMLSDGEWREYRVMAGGGAGERLLFLWPEGAAHDATLTSRVLRSEVLA
jgi:hypothetical protein